MARKTPYTYEKRQKELARQARQDEKRKRKQDTGDTMLDPRPSDSAEIA